MLLLELMTMYGMTVNNNNNNKKGVQKARFGIEVIKLETVLTALKRHVQRIFQNPSSYTPPCYPFYRFPVDHVHYRS